MTDLTNAMMKDMFRILSTSSEYETVGKMLSNRQGECNLKLVRVPSFDIVGEMYSKNESY